MLLKHFLGRAAPVHRKQHWTQVSSWGRGEEACGSPPAGASCGPKGHLMPRQENSEPPPWKIISNLGHPKLQLLANTRLTLRALEHKWQKKRESWIHSNWLKLVPPLGPWQIRLRLPCYKVSTPSTLPQSSVQGVPSCHHGIIQSQINFSRVSKTGLFQLTVKLGITGTWTAEVFLCRDHVGLRNKCH